MLFMAVCTVLVGLILSCEKWERSVTDEDPRHENILRYDVPNPFASLDPTKVEASGSNHIFPLLYSYLFVPDFNGNLEPDLALKWTYDAERFTWTIHLRRDARFHNRETVTSKDVTYTFDRWLKNIRPSLVPLIDNISPLSDKVITIRLKKDDPAFLQKIWDMEIFPHPGETATDPYHHPIGSGPFRFKHRREEKEVVLEANKDYFHGRPSLDGIVFFFQPDKEKAWTRLLSGETDIAQEISPKNYEMMMQYEKRYYFDHNALHQYTILLYNTSDPLFSDPRVRLALSHAIDREYIVKKLLKGLGRIAHGPMGAGSPYDNPEVNPITYNPQKSLDLLRKAGWSYNREGRYLIRQGKRFEFTILVFEESQIEKEIARYITLCLNDLGIRVSLHLFPYEELKKRYFRNNAFQAVLTDFRGVYRDPEILKQQWTSDLSKRSEAGCFEHPEVTRLIRQALEENDPLRKKELFYRIDALIRSLQPGTFLFHKTAIDVMSKRFTLAFPFSLTIEGVYRLRYASLDRD